MNLKEQSDSQAIVLFVFCLHCRLLKLGKIVDSSCNADISSKY